eukprot:5601852-Prymnesium_polylepis.1
MERSAAAWRRPCIDTMREVRVAVPDRSACSGHQPSRGSASELRAHPLARSPFAHGRARASSHRQRRQATVCTSQ